MKKTHLKLQQSGEVAKSSSESRKMMKSFKKRHDLNRGEDAKSNNKLVEMKKKKLMMKTKQGKDKNRRGGNHGFGEKVGDK